MGRTLTANVPNASAYGANSHLQPSTDAIPYAVQGQLWEATASDTSIQGDAVPIVSNFNARAADGQ
ncbi:MAG: MPT63 family protein, partial [Actinomycetia bacterium]|nr:MPT63 family protein [Actinomycetes bacterium]